MSTLVSTYTIAAPAPPWCVLRCLYGKRLWCQGPCQVTANLHPECVFLCFNMFAYLFCCIFFLLDYSFHEQFTTYQEGAIEDRQKEINKDVSVFSTNGTCVCKAEHCLRILGGYNIDLLTLMWDERLSNGVKINMYKCTCANDDNGA